MLIVENHETSILDANPKVFSRFLPIWDSTLKRVDPDYDLDIYYMDKYSQILGKNIFRIELTSHRRDIGGLLGYLDKKYTTNSRNGRYVFEYYTSCTEIRYSSQTVENCL